MSMGTKSEVLRLLDLVPEEVVLCEHDLLSTEEIPPHAHIVIFRNNEKRKHKVPFHYKCYELNSLSNMLEYKAELPDTREIVRPAHAHLVHEAARATSRNASLPRARTFVRRSSPLASSPRRRRAR